MHDIAKQLLENIISKNVLQEKALSKEIINLEPHHWVGLEALVSFFCTKGYSIDDIANAYLDFVGFFLEERKFFIKHNAYRYVSYQETAHLYNDRKYMESYMIGLSLSVYLLKLQRDNMDFFISYCKKIQASENSRFLEVGTGHGSYFVSAIKNTTFGSYLGIDISPTSVEITKEFTDYCMKNDKKNYIILEKDFFDFTDEDKFDMIVMGEILEHVEQPLSFLRKAASIATDNAPIYVSTAINSPFPDHIYIFRTVDEVRKMFNQAGLHIIDEIVITPNGINIEKAIKRKYDIVVAYILQANKK